MTVIARFPRTATTPPRVGSYVRGLAIIGAGLSLFWLTVGFCVGLALSTRVLS